MYSFIFRGKGNPNYKHGKDKAKYPKEFIRVRESILNRDKWTCQLCGDIFAKKKRERHEKKFITVHHIDYNKFNNVSTNLIALCSYCNSSANNSRESWIKIFRDKIDNMKEVNYAI